MAWPMSSADTMLRTCVSPVSRSTSTSATARCPAEGRVGVAAVGLVVEVDVGIGLELLVDAQAAALPRVFDVGDGERLAGRLLDLGAHPRRGLDDQAADDHRRPRRHRRAAVGHDRGVLGSHLHVALVDAQLLGDELRKDRLGALAHLGRCGQHPDAAVGGRARGWRRWPA